MKDPDFDKLTELNDELRRLEADGTLTKEDYERLFGEAKKAVGDHEEFLEGFIMRGIELGFVNPDDL